jgi:beta-lactamase regulating signal transducer with metallopeptidase domain
MMFGRKTDVEFVEALRRRQTWRRRVGLLMIVLGLVAILAVFLAVQHFQEQVLSTTNSISDLDSGGDHRLSQAANRLAYSLGFNLGGKFGNLVTWCGIIIGYGVYLIVGDRRERLLLEYEQKARTANEERA